MKTISSNEAWRAATGDLRVVEGTRHNELDGTRAQARELGWYEVPVDGDRPDVVGGGWAHPDGRRAVELRTAGSQRGRGGFRLVLVAEVA